jgi:sugar lactone lactonase YvrE
VASDLRNESCLPDGMAADAEGHLWVACWGGWQVVRVDAASGRVVARVALPAQYVTSVAWGGGANGGAALDALYVTTSRRDLTPRQRQEQPQAGALFRVTGLGVVGAPANNLAWPLKPLPTTAAP